MSEQFTPSSETEPTPEDLVILLQEAATVAYNSVAQADFLSSSEFGCYADFDTPSIYRAYNSSVTPASEVVVATVLDGGMILDGRANIDEPLQYPVPEGVIKLSDKDVYTGRLKQELRVTGTGLSIDSTGAYRGPSPSTGYLRDVYDFSAGTPSVHRTYIPLFSRSEETESIPMTELEPEVLKGLINELNLVSQVIQDPNSNWRDKVDPRSSGRLRFR